jgi:hypothetical protein
VACHHPGVPADLLPRREGHGHRPHMVRSIGCGGAAAAFLSPPVAMSAYYLKQVVKGWSLATIYAGMFQFMILQVICVGLMITFPDLVPADAARGIPQSGHPRGVQENPGTAEAGTIPGRRRLADTKKEVAGRRPIESAVGAARPALSRQIAMAWKIEVGMATLALSRVAAVFVWSNQNLRGTPSGSASFRSLQGKAGHQLRF